MNRFPVCELVHLPGLLGVMIICVVGYANALHGPFVFDDLPNIRDAASVRMTQMSREAVRTAVVDAHLPSCPVANVSFALNYLVGGDRTYGYHLTNVMIHSLNGVLVYWLAWMTLGRVGRLGQALTAPPTARASIALGAAIAVWVFAAHPVQVQSVTYIVQRMNSLGATFYLLALILYVTGRQFQPSAERWSAWAGAGAAGLLALGCKENTVTLPVAIAFYEWFFFRDLRVAWTRKTLFVVASLSALALAGAWLLLGADPLAGILEEYARREFTMGERVLTELRVVVFYLGLFAWPTPDRLNLLHDFELSRSLLDPWTTFASAAALLGLLVATILGARRHRLLAFCALWYLLHLVIESSIVAIEIAYEHRLYLPAVGLSLAIGYGTTSAFSRRAGPTIAAAPIGVSVLVAFTMSRNEVWADELTLWTDTVKKSPGHYRGQFNLGNAYRRRGDLERAALHYRASIGAKPDYYKAHNNLGNLLLGEGSVEEAIAHFRRSLASHPLHLRAYNNLGRALAVRGDYEAARRQYEAALRIDPGYAKVHYNLGNLLLDTGREETGLEHLALAVRADPGFMSARNNLGIALAVSGRLGQALEVLRAAVDYDAEHAPSRLNLAKTLAASGQRSAACAEVRAALRIAPGLVEPGHRQLCEDGAPDG